MQVPFYRHSLSPENAQLVAKVLETPFLTSGPIGKEVEAQLCEYFDAKHAKLVNSWTNGAVATLLAMDIGPGDEVIVPAMTFISTANVVELVGAKPVFIDCDPETLLITPELIKGAITKKTKAIIPVHMYGQMCDVKAIKDILPKDQKISIIEDCAQAIGAKYDGNCLGCDQTCPAEIRQGLTGKYTGAMGDVGAFSFFPTKNLGAYGDGGLITTNDPAIAEQAKCLRVHGSKLRYQNEVLGYNSRLDALQAAILSVKLPHLADWNQGRRRVAQAYNAHFENVPGLIVPKLTQGHVFHQYTLRVLNGKRDALAKELQAKGISTMIYYPVPQDRLPVYRGQYAANPVSDQLAQEVLSLPIWPEMPPETLEQVAQTLQQTLIGLR